jgi:spore maturation protein CgeB
MKIFCAIRHANDPAYYYGGLWSGNFYPALRQLGHEIVESGVDLLPLSRFMHVPGNYTREELQARAEVTDEILDEVRAAHRQRPLDLFLSYFYNAHFDPAGFDELRRLGVPSLNFYCNSIYQFDLVSAIAAYADVAWHPERDARSRYLAVGGNPVWVQMGADPTVYHPVQTGSRKKAACFVGQRYADRDRWIAALLDCEVPVEIYGPGWTESSQIEQRLKLQAREYLGRSQPPPASLTSYLQVAASAFRGSGVWSGGRRLFDQWRYRRETRKLSPLFSPHAKGPIPFEAISEVFAKYEVCLNFSNVWADGRRGSALVPHVRLRDFEAPMSRTCYLTGESDEIREFYEVGREIVTYSSKEELVEKTRFYLSRPDAAEKLRASGYERARRDHTWVRRFEELFRKSGLPNGP